MTRRYYNYRNINFRQTVFTVLFILLAVLIIVYIIRRVNYTAEPAFAVTDDHMTVIVDPGHGGEDGGAEGYDNKTIEKDINLAVSLKLEQMLKVGGFEVIMTREDDRLINDEGLSTLRERKVSDIRNRMKLIEAHPEAIFLSVHQNKFTESSSHGAQIFFGKNNPESEVLAQAMQDSFHELLQPDNSRQIKKSGKEIYLLYHSEIPSIMVECGFLSNPDECNKLTDDEYQNQVAFTIYAGLMKYIDQGQKELETTKT